MSLKDIFDVMFIRGLGKDGFYLFLDDKQIEVYWRGVLVGWFIVRPADLPMPRLEMRFRQNWHPHLSDHNNHYWCWDSYQLATLTHMLDQVDDRFQEYLAAKS